MYSSRDDRPVDDGKSIPVTCGGGQCIRHDGTTKPTPNLRLDQALVERLLQCHDEAWRWFLTEYDAVFRRALWAASWRVGGSRHRLRSADVPALLEDLKVYFFMAFTRAFKRYEGEGPFRAFLAGAARNFLLERQRVSANGPPCDEDAAMEKASLSQWQADVSGSSVDVRTLLGLCVSCLPLHHRSVILLYHYSDQPLSLSQLAEMMGVSVDAAYKRHQRALAALRQSMSARIEATVREPQ